MSKGVINILDSYKSNIDEWLTATESLNARLRRIREENKLLNLDLDLSPRDIYKTHNFFVSSVFIPHVAVAYDYYKRSKDGGSEVNLGEGDSYIRFDLQGNNGDWITDQVINIVFEAKGVENSSLTATRYRYCDYIGARLFKDVALVIDNQTVSSYTHLDTAMHEVNIPDEQLLSYGRGFGQQEIYTGSYYYIDQRVNQYFTFSDGAQTPRAYQAKISLWIPLIFWYNLDQSQGLNNIRINTKQKYISIKLAKVSEIIHSINPAGNIITNGVTSIKIEKADMYTCNIYVNQEIRDLYVKKSHFALMRTRKNHTEILSTPSGGVLLSQIKYPVEYLQFGFMPEANESSFTDWYKFSARNSVELPIPAIINHPTTSPVQQLVVRTATFDKYTNLVSAIGFMVSGNWIYGMLSPEFYNTHTIRQGVNLNTPRDIGKFLLPFNLLTGSKKLSGHFNNSVSREVYLQYDGGTTISPNSKVKLYVMAMCLNFIIYDGNSVILKYSS